MSHGDTCTEPGGKGSAREGERKKSHHGLAGFRGFLELLLITMETRHHYQKYGEVWQQILT